MNLSIGVIATTPTAEQLGELCDHCLTVGLHWPCVFTEPPKVEGFPRIHDALDPFERGKFANWLTAARWMLDHTHTEFIILANDGLEFSPNCRQAIMDGPINHAGVGYLSLFTSELMAARQPKAFEHPGWCEVSPNRTCVGAECFVFTRQMLSAILNSPVQDEWTIPKLVEAHPESSHAIDAILADACGILGLKTFYHNPSLVRILEQPAVQDWRQGTESKAFGWADNVAATTEVTEDDESQEI